jgi:hypothetical protein
MTTSDVHSERSPLLSYDSESTLSAYDSVPGTPPEDVVLNKVSRGDLIWILAGLWSAVFLGALDGKYRSRIVSILFYQRNVTAQELSLRHY